MGYLGAAGELAFADPRRNVKAGSLLTGSQGPPAWPPRGQPSGEPYRVAAPQQNMTVQGAGAGIYGVTTPVADIARRTLSSIETETRWTHPEGALEEKTITERRYYIPPTGEESTQLFWRYQDPKYSGKSWKKYRGWKVENSAIGTFQMMGDLIELNMFDKPSAVRLEHGLYYDPDPDNPVVALTFAFRNQGRPLPEKWQLQENYDKLPTLYHGTHIQSFLEEVTGHDVSSPLQVCTLRPTLGYSYSYATAFRLFGKDCEIMDKDLPPSDPRYLALIREADNRWMNFTRVMWVLKPIGERKQVRGTSKAEWVYELEALWLDSALVIINGAFVNASTHAGHYRYDPSKRDKDNRPHRMRSIQQDGASAH